MSAGASADLFQGALYVGVSRLRARAFFQAARAFARAADMAASAADQELALGLRHLAAAGYRRGNGDAAGAERQLAHARRRLDPFLPETRSLPLAELLRGDAADSNATPAG